MNAITQDIIKYKSLIKLAIEYFNSREKLRDMKLKKNLSLIGSIFPINVEMIVAAGGIPTFPIRMQKMGDSTIIHALDLAQSLLGGKVLSSLLNSFNKIDQHATLEKIIQNLIQSIFERYQYCYSLGEEKGISPDACYGIKVTTGMWIEKGKNLDGSFFQSIRCSAFEKVYETWAQYGGKGLWIDVAPENSPEGHQLALQEMHRVFSELQQITHQSITPGKLQEIALITNECKTYYTKLVQMSLGDHYPIHPRTFAQIMSLIEICFQDYLSDPLLFRNLLREIYEEFIAGLNNPQYSFDVSNRPKILFTSRFGGWDNIIEEYIYDHGGRVIYADWIIYGFLQHINTQGDIYENFASYLQAVSSGFGYSGQAMAEQITQFVILNKIQGVIYNQLFGCHSLSTGYYRIRKILLSQEIPSTMINFNNVGENREQLKTRIIALMEMVQK